jgi:peptide/nickel transport system substrate-binding protein
MTRYLGRFAAAWFVIALSAAPAALAQKQGGILRSHMLDSPASMSIHEESTVYAERPAMGAFNNLVLFDQHVKHAIIPELATGWTWNEDGTELTFPLHRGVRWEIERKLAEEDARPIVYYNRGAGCWRPEVKGLTLMVNSIYNGWRMEDVWLDK